MDESAESGQGGHRATVTRYFNELRQWEDYFALIRDKHC
jgi:hypothetical protein